MISRKSKQL